MAAPGIFCVEGQWGDLDRKESVLPILELLERLGRIRFIHKDVATPEELDFYLSRWRLRRYAEYKVAYFAMHGEASHLVLTEGRSLSLEELGERLEGRCAGRRIYFGSCSVMRHSARLARFVEKTGAELACGFTVSVDWLESAAFDTVLLDLLANSTPSAVSKRMASARWAPLAAHLGFSIVYAGGRSWSAARDLKVPAQAGPRDSARLDA
ncbi:DUF6642 family protein [Catellatospora sp. IY07-71]|uniref:DUF6642 family protein n=1 Tax=Catellatospora sp. IY07-71 TaxID=2728827 RepID=UPI001BB34861|nr:hypothetical protein [Catellatospora sp. IY07-71]